MDDERSSAFAYYLAEGLRGAADGYAPGEHDERVTVRELAAFVTARVARWAERARGARQTPKLYAADRADFTLAHHPQTPPDGPPVPAAYPGWLAAGWRRRDGWRADDSARLAPAAAARVEAALLAAERTWEAGLTDRAEGRLARELAGWQSALDAARPDRVVPLLSPRSLAAARAGLPVAPPELRQALEALLALRDAVPLKPEELKAQRAAFVKAAAAQPVAAAGLAWDRLLDVPEPSPAALRETNALFADVAPTPFTETLLVQRLAGWEPRLWPAAAVRSLLRTEDQAERTLALLPATFPWVAVRLDEADRRRRAGESSLLAATTPAASAAAKEAIDQAGDEFREVRRQLLVIRDARRAAEDAAAVLAGTAAGVIERGDTDFQDWEAAARAAAALAERLARTPDGRAVPLAEWEGPTAELARILDRLDGPYATAAVQKRVAAAAAGGPAEYRALRTLLPGPRLSARDRESVWVAARQLGRRLHDDALALDRADDDAGRQTPLPKPTAADDIESNRTVRRTRVSAGLLVCHGLLASRDAVREGAADDLAAGLRDAWVTQLPRRVREQTDRGAWAAADRLGRAPAPQYTPPPAGRPDHEPAARLRRQESDAGRAWLADHYRALGELREAVPGAADFYAAAAADCARTVSP
jgi:hypothetical protein